MSTFKAITSFASAHASVGLAMLAFWGAVVFVAYMALTPLQHAATGSISHGPQHIAAFLYLTIAMWFAYRRWMPLEHMALVMFGYGFAIELIQAVIPYRAFELVDLAADATGIGLAAACVIVLGHGLRAQRAA